MRLDCANNNNNKRKERKKKKKKEDKKKKKKNKEKNKEREIQAHFRSRDPAVTMLINSDPMLIQNSTTLSSLVTCIFKNDT